MLLRRQLLVALSSSLFIPKVFAFGESNLFNVAELILPAGTLSRPGAWQRALFEVIQSTSIETNPEVVQIEPSDQKLYAHPFAVLIGNDGFDPLSQQAVEMLLRYVSYGGFLLFDDTTGDPEGPFSKSVRRLCQRLFPTRSLSPLRGDHSVYRSFFLLKQPMGRLTVRNYMEGVQIGEVTPLVYCPNDLSGALDRGLDGRDKFAVAGGEWQRTEAVKLAINLIMYSLTSNYKHDQAHVKKLIEEGRL